MPLLSCPCPLTRVCINPLQDGQGEFPNIKVDLHKLSRHSPDLSPTGRGLGGVKGLIMTDLSPFTLEGYRTEPLTSLHDSLMECFTLVQAFCFPGVLDAIPPIECKRLCPVALATVKSALSNTN